MRFSRILITIWTFLLHRTDGCPPDQDIHPCLCSIESPNKISIICVGEEITDDIITSIVDSVNSYLLWNPKSILLLFRLQRTSVTLILEEVFGIIPLINFEVYDNQFLNLTTFTKRSLFSSIYSLKSFYASNNNIIDGEDNQLIKVFTNFPYLEYLTIREHKLQVISRETFNNKELKNLKSIDLSFNRISIVEEYAFYELSSLVYLNLSNNSLVSLNANSLALRQWSSSPLQLLLQSNQLSADQMSDQLFTQTNRPLILFLQNNNLYFLPENVFRPLIENENNYLIDLGSNPFFCDCQRHKWLFLLSKHLRQKLQNMICDQQNVWHFETTVSKNCFESE